MSKKILVLSASPRKGGNSDTLCDEFIRGAKEAENQPEKIFLRDKKIGYCTGCGVCNRTSSCVQKDDMAQLLEKLVSADVIVIATPVYFYCVSAQLKVMIDRLCPRYTEIADKRFYLIATAAEDAAGTFDGTVAGFRGMLDCLPGAVEAGLILCGGVWKTGEVQSHSGMSEAFEAGYSIQ